MSIVGFWNGLAARGYLLSRQLRDKQPGSPPVLLRFFCDPVRPSINVGTDIASSSRILGRNSSYCYAFERSAAGLNLLRDANFNGVVPYNFDLIKDDQRHRPLVNIGVIRIEGPGMRDALSCLQNVISENKPSLILRPRSPADSAELASLQAALKGGGYRGYFLNREKILPISQLDWARLPDQIEFVFVHETDTRRIQLLDEGNLWSLRVLGRANSVSDLTISETFGVLVRRRRLLLGCALGSFIFCLLFVATAPQRYTASIQVTPNAQASLTQPGSAGSSLSGGGGLLQSLGFGGSATTVSSYDKFFVLLTSLKMAERLDHKYGFLQSVFHDQWDEQRHEWRRPTGPGAWMKAQIKSVIGLPAWSPPNDADLATYLGKAITITPSETTPGIYMVSATGRSPQEATRLLTAIINEGNEVLRKADQNQAQSSVQYLLGKLSNNATTLDEHNVLAALLTDQERTLLLANLSHDYIAQPLDVVNSPNIPSFPPIKLVLLLSPLLGLVIGSFIALLKDVG